MARDNMNREKTLAQKLAFVFGVTFLLAGIGGFIPGITTNLYDGLEFAGDDGNAELLGLFKVSILHNIVHALFAIGILMAATHRGALKYLLGSGIAYIVLFVMGIVDLGDWVPINSGDNWLHLGLLLGLLGAWAASKGAEDPDHGSGDRDRDRDRMGTTPA
ncbi:MAG TPA: DUF4383 domain-containing protein [Gaiellaceae bacterium]|nr:DUF4383 domain-containing protein [Gaiellaceae bacterium]